MPATTATSGQTTVREQIDRLGLQYSKDLHWRAGSLCREAWRREHEGRLPPKQLRRKTLGTGSHMFAIYPASFAPTIQQVLQGLQAVDEAQGRLF